jgi:lysozyme
VLEGVDVSHHQGVIDWRAVASSGRKFAFIRVSDGAQYVDPTFRANWAGAKAAGITRGAYQFFRPTENPIAQADLLLSTMGPLATGDLPPTLDVETLCPAPSTQCAAGSASPSAAADGIAAWIERVTRATGMMPILYVSPSFWTQLPPRGVERRTIPWIANWYVTRPSTPSGWKQWAFWQYTDKGQVPGISAPVDLDRFEGSSLDLRLLTHGGRARMAEISAGAVVLLALAGVGTALLLTDKKKT